MLVVGQTNVAPPVPCVGLFTVSVPLSQGKDGVRSRPDGSELVVVLGQVFPVVGGLTPHKHVPVFKDLLFGQHLVLRGEDRGIARQVSATSNQSRSVNMLMPLRPSTLSWSDSYTRCLASAWAWS